MASRKLFAGLLMVTALVLSGGGTARADDYEWFWGGDVLPRDYSTDCSWQGITNTCTTTCKNNYVTWPGIQGGEVNGGGYCKELVTHYKLWCSCDTSHPSYPACPIPWRSSVSGYVDVNAGSDSHAACATTCLAMTAAGSKGVWFAAGLCSSGGSVKCQCDYQGGGPGPPTATPKKATEKKGAEIKATEPPVKDTKSKK